MEVSHNLLHCSICGHNSPYWSFHLKGQVTCDLYNWWLLFLLSQKQIYMFVKLSSSNEKGKKRLMLKNLLAWWSSRRVVFSEHEHWNQNPWRVKCWYPLEILFYWKYCFWHWKVLTFKKRIMEAEVTHSQWLLSVSLSSTGCVTIWEEKMELAVYIAKYPLPDTTRVWLMAIWYVMGHLEVIWIALDKMAAIILMAKLSFIYRESILLLEIILT